MKKGSTTLTKCWKKYSEKFLPKHPFYIENGVLFKQILTEYNQLCMDLIIEKGYTLDSKTLGDFFLVRRRYQKDTPKYINYEKWNKEGIFEYEYNLHSDSQYARFYWDKKLGVKSFVQKLLYRFKSTRTNNRKLAKNIKEDGINIYRTLNK